MTAVLAGRRGETFEDVGNEQVRLISAAPVSASWASRSACSGSRCVIATRARVVNASIRHQPVVVDTASSAHAWTPLTRPPTTAVR